MLGDPCRNVHKYTRILFQCIQNDTQSETTDQDNTESDDTEQEDNESGDNVTESTDTTPIDPTTFCVGKADGNYANPDNCKKFYQCHQDRLNIF